MKTYTNTLDWIAIVIVIVGLGSFTFGLFQLAGDTLPEMMLGGTLVGAGITGFLLGLLCTALGVAVRALRPNDTFVFNQHETHLTPKPPMLNPTDYEWTPNGYQPKA